MKKVFFFLHITLTVCYAQNKNISHDILSSLRSYNITQADSLINLVENVNLKRLYQVELKHQKTGELDSLLVPFNNKQTSYKARSIYYSLKGDIILKYHENDSLAYVNYQTALSLAKYSKNSSCINHVLKKMNHLLFKNGKDIELLKQRVDEYSQYAKNDVDNFWSQYYKIGYKFHKNLAAKENNKDVNFDDDFKEGYIYAKNSEYLKAVLSQLHGIYYDVFKDDFKNAKLKYLKATEKYKLYNHAEAQSGLFGISVNLGILLYRNKEFDNAISVFKSSLKNSRYSDNGLIDIMFINEWLYKSYEEKKNYDSAYYYFKEMTTLKDKLNQIEYAQAIREIDKRYDFVLKEKEAVC